MNKMYGVFYGIAVAGETYDCHMQDAYSDEYHALQQAGDLCRYLKVTAEPTSSSAWRYMWIERTKAFIQIKEFSDLRHLREYLIQFPHIKNHSDVICTDP